MLPDGTYEADLDRIGVEARPGRGHWLRLEATTDQAVRLTATHQLARHGDDPYDLAETQVPALRQFAARLGITAKGRTVEQVVGLIRGMQGGRVMVRVRRRPTGELSCRFMLPEGAALTGEIVTVDQSKRTAAAHRSHERLLAGKRRAQEGFAQVAQACWELRETDGWIALGYRSAREYCAQPDLKIGKSWFYDLAGIYEVFVMDGGVEKERLAAADVSQLKRTLPAIRDQHVDAEAALQDAVALGRADLEAKYQKAAVSTRVDKSGIRCIDGEADDTRPDVARLVAAAAAAGRLLHRIAADHDETGPVLDELDEALRPYAELRDLAA